MVSKFLELRTPPLRLLSVKIFTLSNNKFSNTRFVQKFWKVVIVFIDNFSRFFKMGIYKMHD